MLGHVYLIVYYKNIKMSNLLMSNNRHEQSKLKSSNEVYEFKFPYEVCALRLRSLYIGYTQITLSRKLMKQLQNGARQSHKDHQDCRISRASIVYNTTIIRKINELFFGYGISRYGITRTSKLFS